MKYRKLGNTGFEVSEIGIGGEYLEFDDKKNAVDTMHAAMDLGVNILDIFMSEPNVRTNLGEAIKGRRDKIYIQGHMGSIYENGQYGKTTDLAKGKAALDDLFRRLGTDYIDMGMLHCIDRVEEWEAARENGVLDYMVELKEKGRFRTLGFSSHNAHTARLMVESGAFGMMLFSINPIFDLLLGQKDVLEYLEGNVETGGELEVDPQRAALYTLCEERGVGITVMKTLGAGVLLNAQQSPFGKAMTVNQCIHYALSRPGVSSVLIGAKNVREMQEAVAYYDAAAEDRDYSAVLSHARGHAEGQCMYCNHCLPCPSQIDVAAVTRLLDGARTGAGEKAALAEQYGALGRKGGECIACGACEKRCPFGVPVIANMKECVEVFGA